MKQLLKRLTKSAMFRAVICWVIANYIRFAYATSHKQFDMDEASRPYVEGHKPVIFAFWHGRLFMMAMVRPRTRKMHALVSTHRDGDFIARTMRHFDLGIVSGSSTRGGVTAAMNAVKALQAGDNVCITPDGPRGPLMQVQPGLITIAELADVPIIPASYSSTRHKTMRSWDRFMVVLPFGRICYKVGAPMFNPTKEALEAKMISLTEEADKACISSINS
jgi:lysophospholipid acyltransferase (LPLAT)-like uncharacterized protein